ncbi:hypothetical protein M407DRAFT_228026 [Tulasnella calospora MUT 4182]|uniref:Uncharacterized protein n=1 Tax=Tulasnella calospora MUT 4182 TaxID=1051891 RepID=A0A0C3QE00_9AGAM|nr:hypothetical protein M407DRAFT_228026 [Tulasnella calospora MUT 4182]
MCSGAMGFSALLASGTRPRGSGVHREVASTSQKTQRGGEEQDKSLQKKYFYMSWFSRKSAPKHSPAAQIQVQTNNTNTHPLQQPRSPASPSLASPLSSAHYVPASPYSGMPRSAGLPSTSANGYLDPYQYQPQNRKESAPARLGSSYSYDDPLAPGPSGQQHRKDGRGKQGPTTSPSITFGGFLSLGGNKLKKPPTQVSDGRQVRSNPGNEVWDSSMEVREDYNRPARPRAGTYDPSSAPPTGNRNRAYTLSSSTATSSGLTVPPTPATSYDGDGTFGGRGRSNSGASTAASSSRKARPVPSLRAVEEYDPFAAGNTNSFYQAPTPPLMTPDSQYFDQPDPRYLRHGATLNGYVEGTFGPKGTSSNPAIINTLKITQRPTVQVPQHANAPRLPVSLPVSPIASNPVNAGPLSKKGMPLLPFRSKSTKEKRAAVQEPDSHSGFISGLLRPNSNRNSGHSATSAPSDVSRSGSIVERPRLLSSPQDPGRHLPVSIGNSPVDFNRNLASPTPSIVSSNHDAPSVRQGTSENVPARTPSENSYYMATSVSTPATSPSQPSSNGHPSRPLSTDSVVSIPNRKRRLRAALAVSVQDIDTSPLREKGGEYDISDVRIEVDVSGLSPASSISMSKGKEKSLGLDNVAEQEERPRASPVAGEDGTFEFLLPPKSPAIRIAKAAKDSPQYGAPSFIEEAAQSPGDHFFFASPYPSGVTTVPVFRESMDLQRDSSEQVLPPEADLPPPKVSVDVVPGDPAASTVPHAFLPPTPSLISDFPSVPDLFHDIEQLMNGVKSSPIPSPPTLPSPRRHLPDPIDPALPVPVPSSADPSPPKTAFTIQPSRPTTTAHATATTAHATATTTLGMSPLKIPEKTTTSSSRRRRGSEPASPRPRVGMDDAPMGTSFGAFGTQQSILSSTPPSAFPAGPNGGIASKKRSIPIAMPSGLYQRTRTPSTGSTKSRNLYNFMSNLASSSTSFSEEGSVGVGGSASSCGMMNGKGTPSSSSVNGAATAATSSNVPKRMRSFNHIPLPPMPSLRHHNSFNPSLSTASESTTPPSSLGASPAAPKVVHTSASTSNLSTTSSAKTEVAPVRKPSTSSKRRILRQSSKASLSHSRPSTAGSISVGPLGEILDCEHDWSKQRARYPKDDDTRSLMTLNRPLGNASLDGHGESQDEMPSAYNESMTSSAEPVSTKSNFTKATKTTSPSKIDFTPMHILPPSELLRLGDASDIDEDTLSPRLGVLSERDSLLHGDFDDVGSTLRDPEGSNWLSDVGVYAGASALNPKTTSVMGIYEGRGFVGIAPPIRGFSKPSPSSRRDSSMSKSSSMTGASRRPSTSQVSSSNSSGVRTPGGPLSPPPLRSRLPRSSISSSIRSFGTVLPQATPLAPPPARSRANSGSEASQRSNGKPPSNYARRGSEFSVLSPGSAGIQVPLPSVDTRSSEKTAVSRNPSLRGMSALRKKRQSLKPSFLDIEFDDEMEEEDEVETQTLNGTTARGSLEDSFLDLGRGASMESTRD